MRRPPTRRLLVPVVEENDKKCAAKIIWYDWQFLRFSEKPILARSLPPISSLLAKFVEER